MGWYGELILMIHVLVQDEEMLVKVPVLDVDKLNIWWCRILLVRVRKGSDNHAKSRNLIVGRKCDEVSIEDMVFVVMVFLGVACVCVSMALLAAERINRNGFIIQ